ncbi:chloride channel protein [Haloimpatiens sp. FM7315]|uniref:chloride channel protein n=1 Tax=Haloimpatiens sp. FM7315 TaxID=3298609 RepID=UPI00370AB27F
MKKRLKKDIVEETILLSSTIKWVLLSIFIGLSVGTAISFFIKIVAFGEHSVKSFTRYYYLLLPIIFFISSFLVVKLAPEAEGHGTEKAIEAVHKRNGKMNLRAMPVKLFTTFLTIIFGGSVGEEGPATQIGAGMASFFSGIFKMEDVDRRRFAVCGISAGFVGVFGAPVGAAIFAAEVLYIGRFSYLALLPSLISSYVSYFVGRFLGTKPLLIYFVDFKKSNPSFMFAKMIAFGIFIGILAHIFIALVNYVEKLFKGIKIYKPLKGIIGGGILILIVLISGTTDYIGMGEDIINKSVEGGSVSGFAFIAKMITSSVTLASGGNGGILTPMAYIGATAGSTWATIIHGHATFYAAMGMVAFLATCSNTPLAGIVMSMELFGAEVGTYCSIVCVVSYLIVGHKSIYPTQVLMVEKSPSFELAKNCAIGAEEKVKLNRGHWKIINKFIQGNSFTDSNL